MKKESHINVDSLDIDVSGQPLEPSHARESKRSQGIRFSTILQFCFVLFVLFLAFLLGANNKLTTLSITFSSIVLEAFPFMLLGALVGGFIDVFVPKRFISRLLPANKWWSIPLAGCMGIVFPVCECAVIPVVRRFLNKGVSIGAAVAYLLGGPIVNPIVTASTYVAYFFNWEIAFLRLSLGFIIAVGVAVLMNNLFTRETALLGGGKIPQPELSCGHGHHGHDHDHDHDHNDHKPRKVREKIGEAVRIGAEDFFDIGRFLVIGAFVAALLQTLIARGTILGAIGDTPLLAIPLMMMLAILLNLCSEADAFIAASLQSTAMPLSAQMSFMVLGPMFDIKLLLMYLVLFRRPFIVALSLSILVSVFVVSYIVGVFY